MRKIIALVLAIVMIAAMSVTASAKTLADSNNASDVETVPVTYTSAQGYEITIPDEFALADADGDNIATGTGKVTATKAKINIGKKLIVTVDSSNEGANSMAWNLLEYNGETAGTVKIGYTIKVSGNTTNNALGQEGTVLSYVSSADAWEDQESTMDITTAYSNQAGTFKDTLTFKSEVVDA